MPNQQKYQFTFNHPTGQRYFGTNHQKACTLKRKVRWRWTSWNGLFPYTSPPHPPVADSKLWRQQWFLPIRSQVWPPYWNFETKSSPDTKRLNHVIWSKNISANQCFYKFSALTWRQSEAILFPHQYSPHFHPGAVGTLSCGWADRTSP